MLGFIGWSVHPLLRRCATRVVALACVITAAVVYGSEGTYYLLLCAQLILSLQLPFVLIPLLRESGSQSRMGSAFVDAWYTKVFLWTAAACVSALNAALIVHSIQVINTTVSQLHNTWITALLWTLLTPFLITAIVLLLVVAFYNHPRQSTSQHETAPDSHSEVVTPES
mmetsp:Transcript_1874/g.3333  ORF Transcript_1874/g.3333 Transcript_1874/m.3333 type:complete len:169 (-) Transcript_1874:706-1212(-)